MRLMRKAANGTSISPPRDIPEALRPMTSPRRRRNHLLNIAPVLVREVPLCPTAATTPNIAMRYQMLPVNVISRVETPTMAMPAMTTMRTPTRSNR